MKTKRQKLILTTITTRDEAESLINEYALVCINLLRHSNKMDAELTKIRDNYQPGLTAYEQVRKEKFDTLCRWAEANPSEFHKGKKSIKFVAGTIGFRTGTPKVKLLNRWTWAKVLAAIKGFGLSQFVRNKPEVDKDIILAHHAKAKDKDSYRDKVLKPIGVTVIKDESFFVDPTLTEVETRQAVLTDGDGYNGAGEGNALQSSEF